MAFAYDIPTSPPLPSGTGPTFTRVSNTGTDLISTAAILSQAYEEQQRMMPAGAIATITIATVEPVIPGTDISVHRIAALRAGGMSIPEILTDFPGLTRQQVKGAEKQAQAVPYFGKPYPRRTLKHFLRKGAFRRLKQELAEIGADA
jgi:uncharacterized protein (DUF433 family)